PVPPSPGVGARRRGPKGQLLPTLPLSAFSPPNTGTSEQFPLAPDPTTINPQKVIDANVRVPGGDLSQWKKEIGKALEPEKIGGIVVNLTGTPEDEIEKTVKELSASSSSENIIAILVPFSLENGAPSTTPSYLSTTSNPPVVLATTYKGPSPKSAAALRWALENGFTVDLDIAANLREGEGGWEALESLFGEAVPHGSPTPGGKVILSNLLPPPDDLTLPIVKLLTHSTYQTYQAHVSAISLYANVFIKFLPPAWGQPTPPTPAPKPETKEEEEPQTPANDSAALPWKDTKEKREWKKRIKMYIGHALEAFGFQRIIFGSSPSPSSHSPSNAGDWYELARESFAELGLEQDDIDAVFYSNAKKAFSSS
ncbi:hypothetical protein K474DRAFT_1574549, partial [Panus rudis PR-1116 ss-1]